MANKSYKFRIYPNKEQEILLNKTFGCVRFIYNKMLADKINYYKETGKSLYCYPSQYKAEFEWLKEVDSLALSSVYNNLNSAYNNFFRNKNKGFPKFKSKKKNKNSYTTNLIGTNIQIVDNHLKLPKLGLIKIKQHREIPQDYKLKSVTVSKTPSGKYFASILFEYEQVIPNVQLDKNNSIGLDYSSHSFYVDSQGVEADYPKFYRGTLEKLAREQRILSKKKQGSNSYLKQKIKVAKVYEHITNQRKDWLHKLSTELANKYDYICVEDINMQKMSQTLNLGKSTMDNGFGMFRIFLDYKLTERGKLLIKIDKWFPSSKMCRFCGTLNDKLTLADRVWTCECGAILNRDENAAINIRNVGLSMI